MKHATGRQQPPGSRPRSRDSARSTAWSTPRGDSEATLTLSSKANLYDGTAIAVTREGDKILFDAENVLPFGILTFSFEGEIKGDTMSGMLTLSGLPNGRTPSFPFEGKVK